MKKQIRQNIWIRWISAALAAVLLLALIPVFRPASAVAAREITVTEQAGAPGFVTPDGLTVTEATTNGTRILNPEWDTSFRIEVQVDGEWRHYTAEGTRQFILPGYPIRATFTAPDYWVPLKDKYYFLLDTVTEANPVCTLSYEGAASTTVHYSADSWTFSPDLTEVYLFVDWQNVSGNAYEGLMRAMAEPDANGALQLVGSGDGWVDHNYWFAPQNGVYTRLPVCTIQSSAQLLPTLTGFYELADGTIQISRGPVSMTAPDGMVIAALNDVTGAGLPGLTGLGTANVSFDYTTGLGDLSLELKMGQPITVQFASNPLYEVLGEDMAPITQVQTLKNEPVPVMLEYIGYACDNWETPIQGYTLTTDTGTTDVLRVPFEGPSSQRTISFEMSCTVNFVIDETQLTKTIGVIPSTGPGYVVTCDMGAVPEQDTELYVNVELEPDYSQSVFTVELPAGYEIAWWEPHQPGETGPDIMGGTGAAEPFAPSTEPPQETTRYGFAIVRTDRAVFPAGTPDLAVNIVGVVKNPGVDPPPSRPSRPSEPEIRVENNLDQEDITSDTKLWPGGTHIEDDVSITTVTDREMEALIDLANKHREDTKDLAGDGYDDVTIVIEDKNYNRNVKAYELRLKEKQFDRIVEEKWDRFNVKTPAGTFSLHREALSQTAREKGNVTFRVQREKNGDKPALDLTLTVDKKAVTLFEEPYGVRVFIPYKPVEGEDLNALIIEYIHDDGTREIVTECSYDEKQGGIWFYSSHLSKFGVAYRPSAFQDVGPDHWANPYVTFLTSRGVLHGSPDGKFRPDDKATRAEFIVTLSRALTAARPPKKAIQLYDDVPAGHFAAREAQWFWINNLDQPIGKDNKLRPGEPITRQDAALLVNNIIGGVGLRVRSRGLDNEYSDLTEAAAYARQPAQRLTAAGVLEMSDSRKFFPGTAINRGEMAQIIAQLLSNL